MKICSILICNFINLSQNYFFNYYLVLESILFQFLQVANLICGLISAILVLIWFNPIYSLLSLILVFLFSFIYLSFLKIKFLSLAYLLVYVGAVVILFLFVIMMLSLEISFYNISRERWLLLNFFFFLKCSLISFFTINFGFERYNLYLFYQFQKNWEYKNLFLETSFFIQDSLLFNNLLYTQLGFIFILLGFILLVGMIGSICIVKTK